MSTSEILEREMFNTSTSFLNKEREEKWTPIKAEFFFFFEVTTDFGNTCNICKNEHISSLQIYYNFKDISICTTAKYT